MSRFIRLRPYARRMIWGGERLAAELRQPQLPGEDPIGEALDASGLEVMPSQVEGGERGDIGLDRLFAADPARFCGSMGAATPRFPLLVKRIDSRQRLSVQVHPDDATAQRLEGEPNGKSEAWVILDAEPGAVIRLGLLEGCRREDFARAIEEGRAEREMREIPVAAGDVFAVPAGCAHAIGAGIYLFEVQQPSDLTYRLYDYDRVGPDGKKRALHVRKGIEAIKPELRPEKARPELVDEQGASRVWQLCDMGGFSIERWDIEGRLEVPDEGLAVLHLLNGSLRLESGSDRCELPSGATLVVTAGPAKAGLSASGAARVLVARYRPN